MEWSFNAYPAWALFHASLFAYAVLGWRFVKSPTASE
jgi:hypothetical protein